MLPSKILRAHTPLLTPLPPPLAPIAIRILVADSNKIWLHCIMAVVVAAARAFILLLRVLILVYIGTLVHESSDKR